MRTLFAVGVVAALAWGTVPARADAPRQPSLGEIAAREKDKKIGQTEDDPLLALSITDDQGTVEDFGFGADVPCAATADPSVGSSCSLSTTFDALMPGAVIGGDRAIWELGQVRLLDAFGDVFADQGVFTP